MASALKSLGKILLVLILLGLFALPALQKYTDIHITNSLLFALTQMFMLVAMASNWNLTGGFTGYIDFGHAVFFGIGAYGTGVMMKMLREGMMSGMDPLTVFWPAMIIGGFIAMLFAWFIGSATLRLKGPYFSIAMLGTFYAMREFIRVLRPITGGGNGLTLPPYLNRPLFYYVTLILAVFIVTMIWFIRRTEFGASLIAIREDEIGAEMRGINTTRHKIIAFLIAAFFTGLVGGLWAFQNTFIDPDIVFFESRTVDLVMMSMLGGLGTVAGPVVGVTVLFWLREFIWANFLDYHLIVQGALLIVIVLWFPEGIMGTFKDRSGTSIGRLLGRVSNEDVAEEPVEVQA